MTRRSPNQRLVPEARRRSPRLRAVAALALSAFLAQECALAAQLAGPAPAPGPAPGSFRVDSAFAKIQETHQGRDGRFIIHLQDAHNNLSAQENLARTLEDLIARYGVTDVFVEGGTRDDSLDHLRPLAERSVRERVARKYLVGGEINAAEYVSIATDLPVKLWGVEDGRLYRDNLERYARLSAAREGVSAYLAQMKRRVERLERKLYPRDLYEFKQVLERFERREAGFSEYHGAIASRAALARLDLDTYPAFRSLGRLKTLEEKIDFAAADRQQRELVEAIQSRSGRMPDALREAAQTASKLGGDLTTPLAFYEGLLVEASAAGIDASSYPALSSYVEYLRQHARVDFVGLVDENDELIRRIWRSTLQEKDALRLWELSEHLALTEKLFSLEIAKPEFDRYARRRQDVRFETLVALAFVNRRLDEMDATADVLPYSDVVDQSREMAETFYRTNEARDAVFVEKTLARMSESGARAAILVTGGYHTPNLTRLFKERGLSYAVVMPYINGQTNRRRYEEILLSQLGDGHPLLAQRQLTVGDRARAFDVMRAAERPNSDVVRRIEIDFRSEGPVSVPVRVGGIDGTPVEPGGARLSQAADWARAQESLTLSEAGMRDLIANFRRDAQAGLRQDPDATLRMFNSFVPRSRRDETGRFLALDLGGTNYRVIVVDMQDGQVTRSRVYTKADIPQLELTQALITGESAPFFDFIADGIRLVAEAEGLDPARTYPLGFSFAFPVRQEAVDVGYLAEWVKGFDVKGVVGQDVVRLLNEALVRRGVSGVKVVALVNDTVATLTADPDAEIGAILGTGTNGAYWGPDFAINTEWGGFRAFPEGVITDVDRALDADSSNPGRHLLEKMVSGKYLGEVARRVLAGLAAKGFFAGKTYAALAAPDALPTPFLTAVADDPSADLERVEELFPGSSLEERRLVRRVAELVLERSARIFVSAVSALLSETDPELSSLHLVTIDGSLYEKSAAYRRFVDEATADAWGTKASNVRYALAKDATGIGAAVIAGIVDANRPPQGARLVSVTLPIIEQAGPEWVDLVADHMSAGQVIYEGRSAQGMKEFKLTDYQTASYSLRAGWTGPLRLFFQRANVGRSGVPNWHVFIDQEGRRQHVAVVYDRDAVAVVDEMDAILSSTISTQRKVERLKDLSSRIGPSVTGARLSSLEDIRRRTEDASRLKREGRYAEADSLYRGLLDETIDDSLAHFEIAAGLADSQLSQAEALAPYAEADRPTARLLAEVAEQSLNQAVDRVSQLEDERAYERLNQLVDRLDQIRESLDRLTVEGPPNVIPEGVPGVPPAPAPPRALPVPIRQAQYTDFESILSDVLGRSKLRVRARLLHDEVISGRVVGREDFLRFFRARISTAVRDGRPAAEAVADRFEFPPDPVRDPADELRRRSESLARAAERAYVSANPNYRVDQPFLRQSYLLPYLGAPRLVEIAVMRPDDYERLLANARRVPEPSIRRDAVAVVERARTGPNAEYRRLAEQYRRVLDELEQLPQEPDDRIETDPLPPAPPVEGARLATRDLVDARLTELEQQTALLTDLKPLAEFRQVLLDQARVYFDDGRFVPALQQLGFYSTHVPTDVPASALVTGLSDQLDRLAYATFLTSPELRVAEPRADAIRQATILQEAVEKVPLEKIRPLREGDIHVLPSDLAKLEALAASTTDAKLQDRLNRMIRSIREKSAPNAVDATLERELVERARRLRYAAALGVGGQSRRGGIFANYMHHVEGAVGKVRLLDYRLAQFAGRADGFQSLKPILIQSPFTETRIDRALEEGRADLSRLALTREGEVERVNAGLTHVFNADGTIWREGSVHGLAVPSHGDAVIQLWPILDELIEGGYEYYGFYNMNVINSVPRPEHVAYLDYLREQAREAGREEPWILFAMTTPIGEKGGLATRGIYDQYPQEAEGILQISEGWTLKKEDLETLLAQPENYPLFSTNAPIVHVPTLRARFFGSVPFGHLKRSYVAQHPDFIQSELLPAIRASVADYGDPDPRNRLGTNIEQKTDPDDPLGHRQIAQTSTMLGSIVKMDRNAVLLAVPRDEEGDYYEFKTRPQVVNLERSVRRFHEEGRLALRPSVQPTIPLSSEDVIRWFLEDNIFGEATLGGQRDFRIVTPAGERDVAHDQPYEAIRALYDLLPTDRYYRNVRVHLDEGVVIVEAAYGEDGGARLAAAPSAATPDRARRTAAARQGLAPDAVPPIPGAAISPAADSPEGARLSGQPDSGPFEVRYRLSDTQIEHATLYLLHLAADLTNWQTPGRVLGRPDAEFEAILSESAGPFQGALQALGRARQAEAPLLRSTHIEEALELVRSIAAQDGPIRRAVDRLVAIGQLRPEYVDSSTGGALLRRARGIVDVLEGKPAPGGARLAAAAAFNRRLAARQLKDLERIVRHSPTRGISDYRRVRILLAALYGGDADHYEFTGLNKPWRPHRFAPLTGLRGLKALAESPLNPFTPRQRQTIDELERAAVERLAGLGIDADDFGRLVQTPEYRNPSLATFLGENGRLDRAAALADFAGADRERLRAFEDTVEVPVPQSVPGRREVLYPLALRIRHNSDRGEIREGARRGPTKGGLRLVGGVSLRNDPAFIERFNALESALNPDGSRRYSLEELRYFLRNWVEEETAALAVGMTVKAADGKLPYGGAKGIILLADVFENPDGTREIRDFATTDPLFRARILRSYAGQLFDQGKIGYDVDVPAPDVGTRALDIDLMTDEVLRRVVLRSIRDGSVQTWDPEFRGRILEIHGRASEGRYFDAYLAGTFYLTAVTDALKRLRERGVPVPAWLAPLANQVASFTSKTVPNGGSVFRDASTGYGVVHVTREVLRREPTLLASLREAGRPVSEDAPLRGVTVKVQGFGGVATPAIERLVRKPGARRPEDRGEGAVVQLIAEAAGIVYKPEGFTAADVETLKALKNATGGFTLLNTQPDYTVAGASLVSEEEFLTLPTDVYIPAALENVVNESNVDRLQTRVIAEAANGAVANGAYARLNERGIFLIPDSLANAGGVTVSYFEWRQNLLNESWDEASVRARQEAQQTEAVESVYRVRARYGVDLRTAADIFAFQSVLESRLGTGAARAGGARLAAPAAPAPVTVEPLTDAEVRRAEEIADRLSSALRLDASSRPSVPVEIGERAVVFTLSAAPAGQGVVIVTASLAPSGPPQALLVPDLTSFAPVFADRITDVRQVRADLTLQRSAALTSQTVPVSPLDFTDAETRLVATRVAAETPALRDLQIWNARNANFLNAWGQNLAPALKAAPEGSTFALSVPLATTFDPARGWTLSADLEQSMTLLASQLKQQNVNGNVLVLFTHVGSLPEEARTRIAARLQSAEAAAGANRIQLRLVELAEGSTLVEGVLGRLDPKLQLVGLSLGVDVALPKEAVGYDAVTSTRLPIYLFGVQLPRLNEIVPTAGLLVIGTMAFSDTISIPADLKPYITKTDSGYGFVIFLVRPQPVTPEIERFLANRRATESSA